MIRTPSVLFVLAGLLLGCVPEAEDDSADASSVEDTGGATAAMHAAVADTLARLAEQFSRAYMDQDLEAIAASYTEDALVLQGQAPIVRGRDSIAGLFAMPEGARLIHHRIVPLDVRVEGDMASDVGHYEARAVMNGDTLPTRYGKYAIVWRRGSDGAWRMAVDMWGPRPSPSDSADAGEAATESAE